MENLKAQAEAGSVAGPATAVSSSESLASRFHRVGNRFALWLDRGIFACLCVIAAVAVQNAFAARWALWGALGLWVLRLPFMVAEKSERNPLVLPLMVFLSLAGVATSLSYAPL